ncbi:MEDS domain-containing protein [Planococcus ruber]|uniref:MEDS domain-containing protein n=1 Tax=Planococcus ruber TaxID=2027871 RepID=UPI001FEF8D23|nr:MEDS domain-containing protein [Planococcus ruber]MCJ1910102.1 MEDS domain-containing protein [Planococcus ruber]
MKEANMEWLNQISDSASAHIFYCFDQLEAYIENAISFIANGIKQDERVLFVENTRIYPMILTRLQDQLSAEELAGVHFVNNFDFYWRNGNFHPPTILAHFKQETHSFTKENRSFRTWGHIEWGSQEDIIAEIELYEKSVATVVEEEAAISVCAYDASRVSDDLKERLINCHNYLMTDDSITCLTINN